jgi:hypothetical protein
MINGAVTVVMTHNTHCVFAAQQSVPFNSEKLCSDMERCSIWGMVVLRQRRPKVRILSRVSGATERSDPSSIAVSASDVKPQIDVDDRDPGTSPLPAMTVS